MKRCLLMISLAFFSLVGHADTYTIDTKGAHAFINFKIKHLGYSWLHGRFDSFTGSFEYDEKTASLSKVTVDIDPASVNSNHAQRDRHLRDTDFLDVKQFPSASFVSTNYRSTGEGKGVLSGDLTLHGVTKNIDINVEYIGGGNDPWGGYRQGFSGTTELKLKDFNIQKDLGPASQTVYLTLEVEGIRQ